MDSLPEEVLWICLNQLGNETLCVAPLVCRRWREVVGNHFPKDRRGSILEALREACLKAGTIVPWIVETFDVKGNEILSIDPLLEEFECTCWQNAFTSRNLEVATYLQQKFELNVSFLDMPSIRFSYAKDGFLEGLQLIHSMFGKCEDELIIYLDTSCRFAHKPVVEWIAENCRLVIKDNQITTETVGTVHNIFSNVCKSGDLEFVKWFIGFLRLDSSVINAVDRSAFRWACQYGHLSVAKYLYSECNGGEPVSALGYAQFGYAFAACCGRGHLETAKWMHTTFHFSRGHAEISDTASDSGIVGAIWNDDLPMVEWLCTTFDLVKGNTRTVLADSLFVKIAKRNSVELLEFLRTYFSLQMSDLKAKWSSHTLILEIACIAGSVDKAQWMLDSLQAPSRYVWEYVPTYCMAGRLDIIEFLFSRGCFSLGDIDYKRCFDNALESAHLNVLKWLDSKYPIADYIATSFYPETFRSACYRGALDAVQWVHHSYGIPKTTLEENGFLETLKADERWEVLRWIRTEFNL